ncbi:MAG: hypothetical protein J1E39_06535 [Eubacterium sp.]|nr:hypothetical protein [Eubacterium sp.]
MKKIISMLTAMAMCAALSISCFAEAAVGESGNPGTGVELVWLPVAICAVILVIVGIVSLILSKKKKKK